MGVDSKLTGSPQGNNLELIKIVTIDMPALPVATAGNRTFISQSVDTGIDANAGLIFLSSLSFDGGVSMTPLPYMASTIDTDSAIQSGGILYHYDVYTDVTAGRLFLRGEAMNYTTGNGQDASIIKVYILRLAAR